MGKLFNVVMLVW